MSSLKQFASESTFLKICIFAPKNWGVSNFLLTAKKKCLLLSNCSYVVIYLVNCGKIATQKAFSFCRQQKIAETSIFWSKITYFYKCCSLCSRLFWASEHVGTPCITTIVAHLTITNLNIANPNIANPSVTNPSVTNPSVTNPSVTNPSIANPSVENPSLANPTQPLNYNISSILFDAFFAQCP